MIRTFYFVVTCVLIVLTSGTVFAQQNLAGTLLEQGRYWRAQGDSVREAETWNKLLLARPGDADALYGLANIAIKAGRLGEAKAYLQKLASAHPGSRLVEQLEQDIVLGTGGRSAILEEARLLAASGELQQALPKYREAVEGGQPVGDVGREYYAYLGYTDQGLQEAIDGLRRLEKKMPDDPQVSLALARHLARNEATRLDGIRRLSRLAERRDIGSDAAESWRDALVWLGPPRPEARPLFEEYLKKNPDDADIRQQLAKGQAMTKITVQASKPDPLRLRTDAAMKTLEGGDLSVAEAEFKAVLAKRPNDSEALGGLGVIRLKQENWEQARELLSRARKGNPRAWQASLRVAEYWLLMQKAEALRQASDFNGARKLLKQARALAPNEGASDAMEADMLLEEGQLVMAESLYRRVLAARPADIGALRGLVGALAQQGRAAEAQALIAAAPPDAAETASGQSGLRAAYALGLAKAANRMGDPARAHAALEEALQNDPSNVWIRLELAGSFMRSNQEQEARSLIDGVLKNDPDDPRALYASATLYSRGNHFQAALDTLARIPPGYETRAVSALRLSMTQQQLLKQADALRRQGHDIEAMAYLAQLQESAAESPEILGAVAQAYADMGQSSRALSVLRSMRPGGATQSADASLLYAGILLRTGQDAEAAAVMRQLESMSLSGSQREGLGELKAVYSVRQAESLRERGDLVAAYDVIAPVLARYPDNVDAMAALARMYAAAGRNEEALELYKKVLAVQPGSAQLHLSAALLAQELNDTRYAATEADIAVELAPDQVEILAGAARIYRAQGKNGRAVSLLKRAVAQQEKGAKPPTGAPLPAGHANPFAGEQRRSPYPLPSGR